MDATCTVYALMTFQGEDLLASWKAAISASACLCAGTRCPVGFRGDLGTVS
jgi:hypothetical protein